MTNTSPTTLIVGVGNEFRGDDGIGIFAARRLRERTSDETRIVESTFIDADVVAWKLYQTVIIIDAVVSGAAVGTIHRFDAHTSTIPPHLLHCSSHGFGVADAIALARVMDWLPPNLFIYGVETNEFTEGAKLSSEAAQVLPLLIERVLAESNELARGRAAL